MACSWLLDGPGLSAYRQQDGRSSAVADDSPSRRRRLLIGAKYGVPEIRFRSVTPAGGNSAFQRAVDALSRACSLKGLNKKSTAPSLSACRRVGSSPWAVMKMIGMSELAVVREGAAIPNRSCRGCAGQERYSRCWHADPNSGMPRVSHRVGAMDRQGELKSRAGAGIRRRP